MTTNSSNNDNNDNQKNKNELADTGCAASGKWVFGEKRQQQRHSRWRIVLLVVGLLTLALLLTGCDVPNADPPCSGTNHNQAGCADPTGQGLKDQGNGGEWYDKWAFDIIRRFASSAAINSVGAGISIFWKIFTTLGSTDFVNCTAGSPQCLAVGVLNNIKIVAMVFFPLILSWKFFKSYIVGAFVDSVYESAFSFVPKVVIAIVAITLLDVLITGAFGISNLLFTTIIGDPQGLSNASSGILGESNCVNQSGGRTHCLYRFGHLYHSDRAGRGSRLIDDDRVLLGGPGLCRTRHLLFLQDDPHHDNAVPVTPGRRRGDYRRE